ncbi:MAG: hypothetical protein ACPGGE_00745 [Poseidonia sp.]
MALTPLLPERLAKADPFERWMAGEDEPPVSDQSLAQGLRELRNDEATATVQAQVGAATYVDDLVQDINLPNKDDLCLKAMGLRTLSQLALVDDRTADTINHAVARHTGVEMDVRPHHAAATSLLAEREVAWEGDEAWMDALTVTDEATKAELEDLNQRARQGFDIAALGGLSAVNDPLSSLNGIGPKLEMYLYAMGIRSYAQLAQLTPDVEARFDELVGVVPGRLSRAKVVEQCLQKIQESKEGNGD